MLTQLAEKFQPGHLYSEKDVQVHDDHATLRRLLVDEGLLQRSNDGRTYGISL